MRSEQRKEINKFLDFNNKELEKQGSNQRMFFIEGKFELIDVVKNKFDKESFSPKLKIYKPE